MSRRLTERIIAILIMLFLLAYVVYQARMYFAKPIATDTVYEYTVSRSLETHGIAVRDEMLLDQPRAADAFYPLEDASRVALGEAVVERGAGGAARSTERIRVLEQEIASLQEAQSIPVSYANTEAYNRDIKSRLGALSQMSSQGRFDAVQEMRQSITGNINKKLISNGKANSFTARISALQAELQILRGAVDSGEGDVVEAPQAGFFSREIDGYETVVSTRDLSEMDVDQCLKLINGEVKARPASRAGRLVLSENWLFAVAVESYNLEWIEQGQTVQIQFEQIRDRVPAKIQKIIDQRGGDTVVLLLSCNRMNGELINLRRTPATIVFQEYTGLRINTADLRFRRRADGTSERGVYILRNDQQVYFRLVDPIYEEAGFILTRPYYSAEEYLQPQRQQRLLEADDPESAENLAADDPPDLTLEEEEARAAENQQPEYEYKRYVILFDQVITKGNDLYDGKTLQDY